MPKVARPLAQLPLPFAALAPFSDLDTSLAASREIVPDLARLEAVVLEAIRAAGATGLCDHEGEQQTGLIHQTYSARRRTLVLKGLVGAGGARRLTASGRHAVAWVAVNKERALRT